MASYDYGVVGEIAASMPAPLIQDAPLTFAHVFRTHARYVLGLVRRLGVCERDAEDVAQEVFLAVHAGLARFEGRAKLKTWLCSICVHKVQDYRRQAFRRRETVTAEPVPLTAAEVVRYEIARKEHVRLLEDLLGRLSEGQRQVFVLYEVEGLSMAEAARVLECPLFTAYGRLRTARREVRAYFERAAKRRAL